MKKITRFFTPAEREALLDEVFDQHPKKMGIGYIVWAFIAGVFTAIAVCHVYVESAEGGAWPHIHLAEWLTTSIFAWIGGPMVAFQIYLRLRQKDEIK